MSEGKADQHRTRVRDVEDEEMEVEHLLAEPSLDRVSVDDFFHVDMTPDVNISGCESYTHQGGDSDEKVHVKLSDISHFDDHNSFEPSTVCEDYLLDTEFVDKDSEGEDIPREGSNFEKSSSVTHSFGYIGSESSTIGVSESPSTSIGNPGFKNGINDRITLCKLHGVPKSKCNCQDQRKEKTEQKIPILYTSQNRRKLQSRLALLGSSVTNGTGLTSFSDFHRASENASLVSNPKKTKHLLSDRHSFERLSDEELDNSIKGTTESSPHKRLCKPPVRYIDEFSSFVASSDEKHSISGSGTPRNNILKARMSSKHDNEQKAFRSFKYAQTPDKPLSERVACALSKEFSPVTRLDSDEETDSDIPDDYSLSRKRSKKYGDRRKHQKLWTLPEVVKLVDGICHYGVGRWTEIQRLFFPTSTYRTPVDLRDKWRNLLKASEALMQNDQEEQDESHKNGHRQLPKETLRRISELARLHPYPVKHKPTHTPAPASKHVS